MFHSIQPLPAELLPFETVDIFPKVEGFIQSIYVDRGSFVKKGQLLAILIAPEMESQIGEARFKVRTAEAQYLEARAKYISDLAVYEKIAFAAKTPGVISPNDLEIAKLTAAASKSRADSFKKSIQASKNALTTLERIYKYLTITAPVDGVVTTRNLHPGAFVGPSGAGANNPIFRIDMLSHLRLVIPVPERYFTSVKIGDKFNFTVPAYPDRTFTATVSRPSYSLDTKYRTEYVELDYYNLNNEIKITSGMFATVLWAVKRNYPTFVVPASAIANTTERTFVINVKNDVAHWIEVKRGFTRGNEVEVFGNLNDGDKLVKVATDELQNGTRVTVR